MDEDKDGLEGSWQFVSKALRYGAGVAVHLSKLRPRGTENKHGMIASGPCGFMEIYSKFNEILRRGGTYRNGAIVAHLDADHKDIVEFINYDRSRIPWIKRCVNVDDSIIDYPDKLSAIMQGASRGDVWIVKKQYNKKGERIYSNVCQEILLKSRDTCLLSHINLGLTTIEELPKAFEDGMKFLCELHKNSGVDESDIYKKEENQIGLGVLGLANFLAIEGIKYSEFVAALRDRNSGIGKTDTKAGEAALALYNGFMAATKVAADYNMDRAFTVAPTASCAYRYVDREGFTTAPEIAPPISRDVDRDSATLGVQSYSFHPKCETAEQVGWDTFFELNSEWQRLMDSTGMGHAISMNWWSDLISMDRKFMARWLNSPLKSLYYSLQVMENTQDKSNVNAGLDSSEFDQSEFDVLFGADNEPSMCTSCSE